MDMAVSGSLKRKFEEVDGSSVCSSPKESDDDICSSDSADSCDSVNPPTTRELSPTSILKKQKRMRSKNVRFDQVTVYYFTRRQGFTSVPSQGGSSLGMARRHNCIRRYTLCEFAQEQEHLHREMLRDHLKEEKLNARKTKLTKNGSIDSEEANVLTIEDLSDEDIDVDNIEVDDYFFLQPLPTKRRRALLRASGVNRIDTEEKHELRAIRSSREECGCDCRFYCDPEVCPCSKAGIKCQVDRMSFPCSCTQDGCANTAGRIEFNPLRVRTHYLHTIMKLELENKNKPLPAVALLYPAEARGTGQPEVQDYREFAESYHLENEAAVLHLQSAEEMDRMKEEEGEDLGRSSLLRLLSQQDGGGDGDHHHLSAPVPTRTAPVPASAPGGSHPPPGSTAATLDPEGGSRGSYAHTPAEGLEPHANPAADPQTELDADPQADHCLALDAAAQGLPVNGPDSPRPVQPSGPPEEGVVPLAPEQSTA
ncbi:cysteine/serine-rich nuclear protein 2 isoform X1 [Callorhinchus milii]|uniref:Cysteine and serine rich nuclear protein 2 n=2 Tax=Callorhinchus milii TaxID=7868 RepID=A0A4W3IHF5_CALMI|nr:cysteine/serine-rich nuclear protein 2 isoform X1 [Callorhinchus milii]XP_042200321.1 cysteine/serine-rich nuclear protein 2 isoform X1 [Callorhinchus milii]XP_042200322.1 cysteine/serine-rich nuclear protein 2 isoform X1 [Callorhinchus milii]|eukprot:gi/632983666/ref/XP_007908759.1/ PREDICTED: cysteine/serine-rich nuclear protein 2 isoform X1 [Callorhinchus milii]